MDSIVTVTEAADDFALITLEDFKTDQGITSDNDDDWIESKIERLSTTIANECNRIFVEQTYSQLFRWNRNERPAEVSLSQYPVSGVTVTENGIALDGSQFEVNVKSGIVYRLCDGTRTFFRGQSLIVAFDGGYDDIPLDLQDATITAVKAAMFSRTRDPSLRAQSQPGLGEQQYWVGTIPGQDGALPQEIMSILDNYRRPIVG